jgi:hypothetical protein
LQGTYEDEGIYDGDFGFGLAVTLKAGWFMPLPLETLSESLHSKKEPADSK